MFQNTMISRTEKELLAHGVGGRDSISLYGIIPVLPKADLVTTKAVSLHQVHSAVN